MSLVDGDVSPIEAECAAEQRGVLRAQEKVLEHRVVGEQYVWGVLANLFSGDDLVGKLGLAGVLLLPLLERSGLGLLGVTGVATEGDAGALQ